MAPNKSRAKALLVTESDAMQAVVSAVDEYAGSGSPVLVVGEPGTGRELIARLLHLGSDRAEAEMVSIKSGSVATELFSCPVESESDDSFQSANGGTLLVMDISELRRSSQRKLSKALGQSSDWDMRFIATASPGLSAAVEAGMFYEPLFRKLTANTIRIPALRDRAADIVPLMAQFVRGLARDIGRRRLSLSTRASDHLLRYPWPGNVAEMKQVARRLVVRAKGSRIEASDVDAVLPVLAARVPLEEVSFEDLVRNKLGTLLKRLDGYPLNTLHEQIMTRVEKPLLSMVMEYTGGNQLKAAEMLGLNRNTLRRKLSDFALAKSKPKALRAKPGSSVAATKRKASR